MNNSLKPGNYMKVTPVLLFLAKYPIQCMDANKLDKHIGEYGTYFETSDLKNILNSSTFRELETEVTTHVIWNEEQKQAYYRNEISLY